MASKLGDILEKVKVEAPSPGDSSADLVVICGEDVHRLHSALLASKAGFFEAALNAPMVEREEGKINIRGVEPEIFKKVLSSSTSRTLSSSVRMSSRGCSTPRTTSTSPSSRPR